MQQYTENLDNGSRRSPYFVLKKLRIFIFVMLAPVVFLSTDTALAVEEGDGRILYGEGSVTTPRTREYTGASSTWSAEASLPSAGAATNGIIMKAAPNREELVAGVVNTSGVLNVYRWNGSVWSLEWNATIQADNVPRFDIAYEQVSGRAMVIYSRDVAGTNEMGYRIYNGSSWTAETTYDPVRTSGTVQYIVAEPRRDTNEIGVAWGDTNRALSANYWTGSDWAGEPSATLETDLAKVDASSTVMQSPSFDIAFEDQSGRLMIAWGQDVATSESTLRQVLRSAGTGGAWGTVTANLFSSKVQIISLESEPGSNYIANAVSSSQIYLAFFGGFIDSANSRLSVWNGGNWNFGGTVSSEPTIVGEYDLDVGWVTADNKTWAVSIYDGASSGVRANYYNKTASTHGGAISADGAAPNPTSGVKQVSIERNPYDESELLAVAVSANGSVFTKRVDFNGTNLTFTSVEPGGSVMEANVAPHTTSAGWATSYVYQPIPPEVEQALTIDIVDEAGASIPSPTLLMSNRAVSPNCQNSIADFGANAQRIRVQNTTSTPGWSLSMAATNGPTANWSSDVASYDYNDIAGSPAGCDDNDDVDSLAGRLRTNFNNAFITPEPGCSLTGISTGSNSGFREGVIDSVTLLNASSSAQTDCYWDLFDVRMAQYIPAFQEEGSYSIDMTLTVVAD